MLTAGTEGTLYEIANEMFNEIVMDDDNDWDIYYDWTNTELGYIDTLIDEIIDSMIGAADKAMRGCALTHKDEFLEELRRLA